MRWLKAIFTLINVVGAGVELIKIIARAIDNAIEYFRKKRQEKAWAAAKKKAEETKDTTDLENLVNHGK